LFHAKIVVTLRKSILDPQGKAVEHGIHSLGFTAAKNVRMGKYVEMNIATQDKGEAERVVQEVCRKLLANPVMEDFSYELEEKKVEAAV